MKFLEEPKLSWLTSFLGDCSVGDRVLHARLEAFSCKKSTDDKKLAKELVKSFPDGSTFSAGSPQVLGTSPFGEYNDAATRKILLNLISTMNASFPDYDFSHLRPDHFQSEKNLSLVMNSVNTNLAEFVEDNHNTNNGFLTELWNSIDNVVNLKECEVYSYVPEMEADPFTDDGSLWSFNYFFYNRREKKLVYFTCIAKSKLAEMDEEDAEELDDDEYDAGQSVYDNDDVDMEADSIEWDED